MSYKLEPAMLSHGTGQRITWFERWELIITWCHISKKYKVNQGCMSLSMAAILRDSTVVVAAVVRSSSPEILLALITTRKSIHGFPLVFYMVWGCHRSSTIKYTYRRCINYRWMVRLKFRRHTDRKTLPIADHVCKILHYYRDCLYMAVGWKGTINIKSSGKEIFPGKI